MRVVVQGPGSLGSLVGGVLAGGETAVTLLGHQSEHLTRVREDGLRVVQPDGTTRVTRPSVATDPSVVADADLVVVCVKSYDTASAARALGRQCDGAMVLTLQNGLGNAAVLAEHVPADTVLVGTTTHGAAPTEPGVVRHASGGETTIGRYRGANDARVASVAAAFSTGGMETTVTASPQRAVWEKVLVNVGINAATALADVDNGALVECPPGERVLERAVTEGVRVAEAEGVSVSESVVERARQVAARTASNESSMRQDLAGGARTEVESLHGAVVERARDHDIAVPVIRTLADLVRLAQRDG
ncbi:2-dehydropantoate 2-reductase [Halobacterium salinarum]|uniref:2-dehydropantoate 2-reductase n=1 Tax=Halobacterium salinarum TaxID=2242 RepID=UPI0025536AED|nr:2-dehydropantoate 2-reductase [Halobacterium salinarum]MDL0142058.1 2-dehydropantoate 2-reductase [Halobacterium salinarum]